MFHILGAGSLGLLWATRLAGAGLDCVLLLRDQPALERWQAAGSQLTLQENGHLQRYHVSAELTSAQGPIDRLIVATKAYSVTEALSSVAHRLLPNSDVLLLQNGLGSQQVACKLLPAQRVLFASVTDGAWLADRRTVVWAGRGTTRVGDPLHGPEPAWLAPLRGNGVACQWEPDILPVLWEKLAINCAINPFTALYDCPNGAVPVKAGARLTGVVDDLQRLLTYKHMPCTAQQLPDTVAQVIARTAANSSSMRQDLAARRRTEIDYLLGFACCEARGAGVPVPNLDNLYAELQSLLAARGLPTD